MHGKQTKSWNGSVISYIINVSILQVWVEPPASLQRSSKGDNTVHAPGILTRPAEQPAGVAGQRLEQPQEWWSGGVVWVPARGEGKVVTDVPGLVTYMYQVFSLSHLQDCF